MPTGYFGAEGFLHSFQSGCRWQAHRLFLTHLKAIPSPLWTCQNRDARLETRRTDSFRFWQVVQVRLSFGFLPKIQK